MAHAVEIAAIFRQKNETEGDSEDKGCTDVHVNHPMLGCVSKRYAVPHV